MENTKMMGVKIQDYASNMESNNYPFFDFSEDKGSLGFMELLGAQDYSPLLDFPLSSHVSGPQTSSVKEPPETKKECSEVTNNNQQPATPNSSSISSASSEVLYDEQNKTVDLAPEHQKTKEQ